MEAKITAYDFWRGGYKGPRQALKNWLGFLTEALTGHAQVEFPAVLGWWMVYNKNAYTLVTFPSWKQYNHSLQLRSFYCTG